MKNSNKQAKNALYAGIAAGLVFAGFRITARAEFVQNTTGLDAPATTLAFSEIILAEFTHNVKLTDQYADYGVTFNNWFWDNSNDDTSFHTQFPCIYSFSRAGESGGANNDVRITFTAPVTEVALALGSIDGADGTTFGAYLAGELVEEATAETSLSNENNFYGFRGILFDEFRIFLPKRIAQADNLQFTFAPPPGFFQNTTGLGAPGRTLTFNEIILAEFTHNVKLTDQYAEFGVSFQNWFWDNSNDDTSFHTQFPCIYSFSRAGESGGANNDVRIKFTTPVTDAALALGSIDGADGTTFGAYLGGELVMESTVETSLSNENNFYGFRGILFDEFRIFLPKRIAQADNLQFTFAPIPPRFDIALSGGDIVITWEAGVLESGPTVEGPWTPTAEQTNPQIIPAAAVKSSSSTFYRLR